MAENFPGSLQDKFNEQGFSYQIGETKLTSSMDVGPSKMRRRFTKGIDKVSASINLEYDDKETLVDFHNTTLNGGVDTFLFEDPFTLTDIEYRFVEAPSIDPIGGRWFNVKMKLEIIP